MKNSLAQLCSFGTQQKIVIFNKKIFFFQHVIFMLDVHIQ